MKVVDICSTVQSTSVCPVVERTHTTETRLHSSPCTGDGLSQVSHLDSACRFTRDSFDAVANENVVRVEVVSHMQFVAISFLCR